MHSDSPVDLWVGQVGYHRLLDSPSKSNVKAVLKPNKLILSKNEIFVGKEYATDDMYKLNIINKEVYGCAYIVDSSYLWHARLEHLNFKYLKFMSN